MDDLVTYLIVTCSDKNFVMEAHRVTHRNSLHATVAFVLEVMGATVVTST